MRLLIIVLFRVRYGSEAFSPPSRLLKALKEAAGLPDGKLTGPATAFLSVARLAQIETGNDDALGDLFGTAVNPHNWGLWVGVGEGGASEELLSDGLAEATMRAAMDGFPASADIHKRAFLLRFHRLRQKEDGTALWPPRMEVCTPPKDLNLPSLAAQARPDPSHAIEDPVRHWLNKYHGALDRSFADLKLYAVFLHHASAADPHSTVAISGNDWLEFDDSETFPIDDKHLGGWEKGARGHRCAASPALYLAEEAEGGEPTWPVWATVWSEGVEGLEEEEMLRLLCIPSSSLDSEVRIMRAELQRLQGLKDRIKENQERIKVNKVLPYLVSNVVELLELEEQQEEEGANVDLDAGKTQCAVIKTSTGATYFLPVIGLVQPGELKPGDLVGVNKDSYLVLEELPAEYDSRVKAMEIDVRPTEQYSDIGGLDKQIQEVIEACVLPMTHKERFINLGIQPPKGVLLYGLPGTGKTMLARAVAAHTKSTFLKLAGPQLVQMSTGDGAKLVRDVFALAKEKAPTIIFIDELDAIGTKRFDSEKAGDREVQRTMLELLNQLDGFQPNADIKIIAATNRVDILDPALLRSGRLDRKMELPPPNEEARARIMQIHAPKMNVSKDVNFEELARCTDDFNGAQCKAVCVEAGMIGLRREAAQLRHEDFMDAIPEVQAKKKATLNYYA